MAMTKEQALEWLETIGKRDGTVEIKCNDNGDFSIDGMYCDPGKTLIECVENAKIYDEDDTAWWTPTRTV